MNSRSDTDPALRALDAEWEALETKLNDGYHYADLHRILSAYRARIEEVAAEAAPIDVDRLARAIAVARPDPLPTGENSWNNNLRAMAIALAREYAALAATSREGG